MDTRYEQLHYPGDVTGSEDAQPGRVLGGDEFGRPYEVIDAVYEPCEPGCDLHGTCGRTTVNVQYAVAENIVAAYTRLTAELARTAPPPRRRDGAR